MGGRYDTNVACSLRANPSDRSGIVMSVDIPLNPYRAAARQPSVTVSGSTSSRGPPDTKDINEATTSSTYTRAIARAGSSTVIGSPMAIASQKVATTEL